MPKDNVGRSLSITSRESYSAVIIADMVAEVQDQSSCFDRNTKDAVQRSNSARSEVLRRKGKKDGTNLAFDGHQTSAVVDVEAMGKSNGSTDITKGVILNAQLDHKLGSDFLNGGGGKAIELQDAGGGKVEAKEENISASLKDMSVLRRIAFAASFLPSIMFVLCFAVILPCHKTVPCIEEMWSTTLNNTEVTSGLRFPEGIVFAYTRNGAYGLQWLHQDTGITAWREESSPARFFECANLLTNDSQACLISDPTGAVHFYNAETGEQLLRWNPSNGLAGAPTPSLPAVLPDCDGDGVSEVAVATSPFQVKVLFKGFTASHVEFKGLQCDGTADRLIPWTTANGTDVVFHCQNGTDENLVRISQEKWCTTLKKNKGKGEIMVLDTRTLGTFENSIILPTENGIIVWSGREVTMIESNGQKRWSVNIHDHSSKNRFLLYGKFNKTDSQVALFSSDISKSLQITTLSSETGESVWNRSLANAEVSDVSLAKGSEKDFVLVVMRKVEKDLTNQSASHIGEVSTSIINLLSTEKGKIKAPNATGSIIVEEISFMELNGEFTHTIEERKMSFSEGETFSSKVTVIPKQDKDKYLCLIVLRKPTELASDMSSQLKRVNIANWDISISSNKQCIVQDN